MCAAQVCFVLFWLAREKKKQKTRTKQDEKEKSDKDQRFILKKQQTRTQNPDFVLASCCVAARWLKNESQSERRNVYFNRDAVRELRRQLARVEASLSEDNEHVMRIAPFLVRRSRTQLLIFI